MHEKGPTRLRRAFFVQLLALRHNFFRRQLAVYHALDARDAVVFGDVDGPDALRVAAQRTDRFLLVVSMPISIAEIH